MTGRARRTAVAAVAASLGLTGVVLLAAAPVFSANASTATVTVPDPGGTDGGVIDGNQPTVDVTTTVTVTAAPTETADPVVTITTTVTPIPTVTRTKTVRPTPTRTIEPPPSAPPTTQQPVLPTHQPVQTADQSPTESPSVSLTLPSATPIETATTVPSETPAETATAFEEPNPESVAIEIRNAAPEYDQIGMSRQLAVPGILLVLLVMFAVFVFQSRLQRMAHAAAVRKAGPRQPGGRGGGPETGAYPGPAYAPIIGFVPMQPVVMPPAQPYGVYPLGYPPAPGPYGTAQPGMFQQMPPGRPAPQPGQAHPQPGAPMPPQPDPSAPQTGQAFPAGGPQAAPGPAAADPPGPGSPSASADWFTPRTESPPASGPASADRPGDGSWFRPARDAGEESTLLLPYQAAPRPALEPGPSAFADRPVETTVSVERIGPDGRPMRPRGTSAEQGSGSASETDATSGDAASGDAEATPDEDDAGPRRR